MQIQIQFIDVSVEDKGKYKMAEITFKDLAKGQTSSKKLMSFSNPVVYKTLVDAKKGEVYTIEMQKNDKGFWDWTAASTATGVNTASGGSPEAATKASGSSGFASPKSTYETPEERAKKQVYIVKQSSITNAIEYLNHNKKNYNVTDILETAQMFVDFIFGEKLEVINAELPVTGDDDDIPF